MRMVNKILWYAIILIILTSVSFAYVNRETATELIEYVENNAREDRDVAISLYKNVGDPERYFAPTHNKNWVEIDSNGRVLDNGRTFQNSDQIIGFIQSEGYSWEVGEMQARDFSNLDTSRIFGTSPTPVLETSACFLESTMIKVDDNNEIRIENIEKGDLIMSYNDKPIISSVKNIFSHIVNDYLIVNGKIKVTPHHYVYARRN